MLEPFCCGWTCPDGKCLCLQGQGLAKFRSFWRGMGVTLAKDVPFAAAYWSVLEPLRATMLPRDPSASRGQVCCLLHSPTHWPCSCWSIL